MKNFAKSERDGRHHCIVASKRFKRKGIGDSNRCHFTGFKKNGMYKLYAPANFSLIDNTDEMVQFFEDIKNHQNVLLDMQHVSNLTPETMAYTLSILDIMRKKYAKSRFHVLGTMPKDPNCRKIFNETGFLNHVKSVQTFVDNPDIFSIKTGDNVDGSIAQALIVFLRKYFPDKDFKGLYESLVECMLNACEHAYEAEYGWTTDTPKARWHLLAYYNSVDKSITITILDNGLSIPRTIRKSWLMDDVMNKQDVDLILSALKGECRTVTRESHRGKGLPSILKYQYDIAESKELCIISRKGSLEFATDKPTLRKLHNAFEGTLFRWKIS